MNKPSKLEVALQRADDRATSRVRIRADGLIYSPAPTSGVNAGAVYVKLASTGDYLGKIKNEIFYPTHAGKNLLTTEQLRSMDKMIADPQAASIEEGRKTGRCAICGRVLTNHASIRLGIGPICADRLGFSVDMGEDDGSDADLSLL